MKFDLDVTSTVFHYIVDNLKNEIELGYINNVQLISEDFWKIKIHKKTTKTLFVNPNICFVSNYNVGVIENKGFAKYLKKKLDNQRIHKIYQDKNNRVICFELDSFNLIFEFFAKSNIILTDKEFKIITSKQKEEWKDRTIKKFEIYKFPEGKDITEINKKDITKNEKKEIIREITKKYQIAPYYLNQIIKDEINKDKIIKDIKKLYDLDKKSIEIISKNNKNLAIIKENENKLYENVEKYFLEKIKVNKTETKNKKLEKIKVILKEQEKTRENFIEKMKVLKKEGELIYSHFIYIEEINKIINQALKKEISSKEIIKKINNYFLEKNIELEIKSINQKNKTYILNIK